MKIFLLLVGTIFLLLSSNVNANSFELRCYIKTWIFSNGETHTFEDDEGDYSVIFENQTSKISRYAGDANEGKAIFWTYNDFSFEDQRINLNNILTNRGNFIDVLIDFRRNIIIEEHRDSTKTILMCRNIQELAQYLEGNSNSNSFSDKDLNTIIAASSGTGFFVSTNGHMVTNNHVIDSCDTVKAHYKGRELDADVLFNDRTNDLAIIKVNIKPDRVFAVSNEDVSLLEDIIVAGYPLGKNISASIKTFKGSVTSLSGFGDNYSNFQIDASLSSGNSGGPIINQKGNVVGVAVEKLVEVGVEGFNFGVKSSTLKTFASSNQFKFQDPSTEELSNKELGQLITEATIYLECWMSVAKIKQIIEEGERQKAFFSDYK